jgi:hypothetical protein
VQIFKVTPRPRGTPWGNADQATQRAPGIWEVSTPGHGGFLISAERRAAMPEYLKSCQTFAGGNAYEEDCDWVILALAWPDLFKPEHVEYARKYFLSYDRTEERYPGETVGTYFETWRAGARAMKLAETQTALFA